MRSQFREYLVSYQAIIDYPSCELLCQGEVIISLHQNRRNTREVRRMFDSNPPLMFDKPRPCAFTITGIKEVYTDPEEREYYFGEDGRLVPLKFSKSIRKKL